MENDEAGFRMDDMRGRFVGIRNRKENGTAPRAVTAYQLFQTPVSVATDLVALAGVSVGMRVLEPSAGLGRILDALAVHSPSEVVAVEQSPDCCWELFTQDREAVRILQRDFLTVTPEEAGTFDVVAMNPPFHMRSDIQHILHARQFVKPGVLVAICMDTAHREKALRHLCSEWIQLPGSAFKESNTNTATVMLKMLC
jgi:predicted RNA methylase